MLTATERASIEAPLEAASTLPPRAYTDATIFERERTAIFYREWMCVARVEQVRETGDFVQVDVCGQPLIVVRLASGDIHAMSAVCLHRAMPVASGSGNCHAFSCPYHLWKYDLEGNLVSAPLMDKVDFIAREHRLPAVRVEVWQGFVFVNLDPQAAPLSPRLAGLTDIVANYGIGELEIAATVQFDSPWNWKLLVENFMEAYHHIGPHVGTFQPHYPAKDSYVDAADDHLWSALHMPARADAEFGEEGLPSFPQVTEKQKHHLLACVVSPTMMFAPNGNLVAWYQMMPDSHDHMDLKIHLLLRPETVRDPVWQPAIEATLEGAKYIHGEDIVVNEGPWRGVHAPLAVQGRLSALEKSIWHMNQFWLSRVGSSD